MPATGQQRRGKHRTCAQHFNLIHQNNGFRYVHWLQEDHPNLGYGISFAPNGKQIGTGDYDKVHLRSFDRLSVLKTLTGATGGWVEDVSFGPDGRTVARANRDGTVTVWDASTGERLSRFIRHTSTVNKVTFSPNGRTLASCSNDGTVLLWAVPQR